jgi:hypothetical protein
MRSSWLSESPKSEIWKVRILILLYMKQERDFLGPPPLPEAKRLSMASRKKREGKENEDSGRKRGPLYVKNVIFLSDLVVS